VHDVLKNRGGKCSTVQIAIDYVWSQLYCMKMSGKIRIHAVSCWVITKSRQERKKEKKKK